ncbi:hypothetical protein AB0J86_31830 [Micromonospora sp. NPDC049559]|uniref:hypothetical protein n=1 Tax=Micromonospora sp. NPDC049559 TaxID=3155923 RepID=UPI003424516C
MSASRVGAALVGGGGVVSALATVGWPALVLMAAMTVTAVVAMCWVLNDRDRPRRLALLIAAWRGQRPGSTGGRRAR